MSSDTEKFENALEFMKDFDISDDNLLQIIQGMENAFEFGFKEDPNKMFYTSLKMEPAYIGELFFDDIMEGRYFSLDLGGTTLRIFTMENIKNELITQTYSFKIPKSAKCGEACDLFGFIAFNIKYVLDELNIVNHVIDYFGFTFSFPCSQDGLCNGRLLRWTKGFTTKGCIGEDVAFLLKKYCDQIGLIIKSFILMNDTTATFISGIFQNKHTVIGIINGTGSNACYLENVSKVKILSENFNSSNVLINTEWGRFGECGRLSIILTNIDKEVDNMSLNPKHQIFEKAVSGLYLGEIARICLIEMERIFFIFDKGIPKYLYDQNSLPTNFLSCHNESKFIEIFQNHFNYLLSKNEIKILFMVFDSIVKRASKLIGAALVALLKRIESKNCAVAADGSLFRFHPTFKDDVKKTVDKYLPSEKDFSIFIVKDASVKGAALAAFSAHSTETRLLGKKRKN